MTKIHHGFIEVDKLRPWKEYSCGVCSVTGEIPDDLISCEGATPSVTIVTSIFETESGIPHNSDMEVFVNGVLRGIWPCSRNNYVNLSGSVNLPELTTVFSANPNLGGIQTTITNATSEPVRLEFRAIDAPMRRGGFLIMDPYTGVYNPSAVIEFPGGNVVPLDPDGNNPWDVLKVCLAPADAGEIPGDGGCTPTFFMYNGLARVVTIPSDPNPVLYYKVQVQIDNDPPTEHILVNGIPDENCNVLFVQLLEALLDIPVTLVGDITAYDGDGIPHNYNANYGEFGFTNDEVYAVMHGFDSTLEGAQDRSTTLTFLTPLQAELDAYSIAHEVTAVDGANFLFGEYPTLHSCRYIPAISP